MYFSIYFDFGAKKIIPNKIIPTILMPTIILTYKSYDKIKKKIVFILICFFFKLLIMWINYFQDVYKTSTDVRTNVLNWLKDVIKLLIVMREKTKSIVVSLFYFNFNLIFIKCVHAFSYIPSSNISIWKK